MRLSSGFIIISLVLFLPLSNTSNVYISDDVDGRLRIFSLTSRSTEIESNPKPIVNLISPSETFNKITTTVFPIYAGGQRLCTAFHIDKITIPTRQRPIEGFINVTAGHCTEATLIRIFKWLWYRFDYEYAVQTYLKDSGTFLSATSATPERREVLRPIKRDLIVGETLIGVGYGDGLLTNYVCVFQGDESQHKGRAVCNRSIRGGASGAPLATFEGEVAGIVTHIDFSGVLYFTKIETVLNLRRVVVEP